MMPVCNCKSIHELCSYHQKLQDDRYFRPYIVIGEPTAKFLEREVGKAISKGYKPIGGMTFKAVDSEQFNPCSPKFERSNPAWSRDWDGMYYQAMIKVATYKKLVIVLDDYFER